MEKRLLTLEEFMDEYSMRRSSALTAIKKGKLKTKKMSDGGRKIYITREAAEDWKDSLQPHGVRDIDVDKQKSSGV